MIFQKSTIPHTTRVRKVHLGLQAFAGEFMLIELLAVVQVRVLHWVLRGRCSSITAAVTNLLRRVPMADELLMRFLGVPQRI